MGLTSLSTSIWRRPIASRLCSIVVLLLCPGMTAAETSALRGRCTNVLVTGAAGFIGFHLSRTLATRYNVSVIGIDSFNDYYDVTLKRDRAFELSSDGVRVYHADVCDGSFVTELVKEFDIKCVVHLAAQAGVRYSVKQPQSYAVNNVDCFVTLLDVVSAFKSVYLVYASTSSVYGPFSPVPFSIARPLERPGNMYAMTKQANERLAILYCNITEMRHVGLRFFTVYGPWGRPDMAAYKFAEKILSGEEIPLFHASGSQTLERDFTYVSDVVDGIVATLNYKPSRCGEVFNLGHSRPEIVSQLVEFLEEDLGLKAAVNDLPLPPTELIRTYADITVSKEVLGYNPTVSLRQGVKLFIDWFLEYRKLRLAEMETAGPSQAQKYFNGLLEERLLRESSKGNEVVQTKNKELKQHLKDIRQRFLEYTDENKISLPTASKTEFIFHEGKDSPGYDLVKLPALKGNIGMLMKVCQELERCSAFTTDGILKTRVGSMAEMTDVTSSGDGLYVADMDLCAADLHSCSKHAHCVSQGPGKFNCVCHDGRWGENCVPRLVEDSLADEEVTEDKESDEEWASERHNAKFVFFQGVDSPGGDFLFAEQYQDDIDALKRICRNTKHCLAFHTNGVLKSSVRWGTEWIVKSGSSVEGLYVLDVDYCSLDVDECPDYSHCRRLGVGNYSCVCEPGLVMSTRESAGRKSCLPVEISTGFSFFNKQGICIQGVDGEECHIPEE